MGTGLHDIVFLDKDHYEFFKEHFSNDCYRNAVMYLFGICEETRIHLQELFDDEGICIEAFTKPWQTGTTMRVCRLAFNLWNGFCGRGYPDEDGEPNDMEPPSLYTPYELFDYGGLQGFFWEAIKLRFPHINENEALGGRAYKFTD